MLIFAACVEFVDGAGPRTEFHLLVARDIDQQATLRTLSMLKIAEVGGQPLTVVGLNMDAAPDNAKNLPKSSRWNWAQNLAISAVPAYYLIGADGKLFGSANQWEQIEKLLDSELR